MSEQPDHDCGHICCDEPNDPFHDHFLTADQCGQCRHQHELHRIMVEEFERLKAESEVPRG